MFFDNDSNIFSQNYSQEVSLLSQQQQENGEKIDKSQETSHQKSQNDRIEHIFEENRQLAGIVTGSLESLDKYHETLDEDLEKLDVELKENEEIFEQQRQILIDLQMQIENMTSKYQQKIQERKDLEDETKIAGEVTTYLLSFHNVITNSVQNFQDEYKLFEKLISEEHKGLKQLQEKSMQVNKEFETQRDILLNKLSTLDDECMMYEQQMTNKRGEIREKILEQIEKKEKLEDQMNKEEKERDKLSEYLKNITIEYENEKEKISMLKQKLKEVERKKIEGIPKLKFLIRTAENELANVTKTKEANENTIGELKLKCNQSSAKIKQLESSIAEARNTVAVTQEENMNITKMNDRLENKKQDLKNEFEKKDRKQVVILRLRKKLEDRKAYETNLKNKLGINKNKNIEANKMLKTLKEEVEGIVALKNNLVMENTNIQEKVKEQELLLQKNKEEKESKKQIISETTNFQKEKVCQQRIAKDNLTLELKGLKEKVLNVLDKKNNLEKTYKTNLEKLEASNLKCEKLKKKILENSFIYNEAISDEESKLSKLEDDLIDCTEELGNLSHLNDLKDKKETELKEMEKLWIAERSEEIEKFEIQKKDLEKERALYQANIDAISQQEEKKLVEMEHMIGSKKQSLETYEKKFNNCKIHLEMSRNKEEEYKNKIVKLEEKLNQVSNTAKVTRKDIKTAFAPNIEKKDSKPVKPQPEKKRKVRKQGTFTKDHEINLMTPTSSVGLDVGEKNIPTKVSKGLPRNVKQKDDPFNIL